VSIAEPVSAGGYGPRLAHPDWQLVERGVDGEAYRHRRRPFTLIWSVAVQEDGEIWQHMSMAHRDRVPTWMELVEAKEWLMGTDTYAYQVAPPRRLYVNQNPNVLHLFRMVTGGGAALDNAGKVLPEFSDNGRTL
jgi:hypothetical protein